MREEVLDKYRLAGLDDRERGFSRPVEFQRAGAGYQAILRYESTCVITEPHPKQDAALLGLIQTLQGKGYRQLRTQLSFHGDAYLGAQAPWVEYADLPEAIQHSPGVLRRILSWFRFETR